MSTVELEQMKSIALDALALIAAAERGDNVGAATIIGTFRDAAEVNALNAALTGQAAQILRVACEASGRTAQEILAPIFREIRDYS